MRVRAPALVCSLRPHGETAVIARLFTRDHGLVAAYVAGGRGRTMRPALIPGNMVDAEISARSPGQLPWARVELVRSRGPWLSEPLPAAAMAWVTTLSATVLPERQAFPALFDAMHGVIEAVCAAPSARGWLSSLVSFELLVLRELGYGEAMARPGGEDMGDLMAAFDSAGRHLARYLLADRRGDVMGSRALLRDRLARIGA